MRDIPPKSICESIQKKEKQRTLARLKEDYTGNIPNPAWKLRILRIPVIAIKFYGDKILWKQRAAGTLEPEPPARSLTYVNVVTFTYVK